MERTRFTCGNGEMHDQDIRSLRELDESRVGTGLIGAEYDRHVPRLNAVRQSRKLPCGIPDAVTVTPCRSNTFDGSAFVTSTTPTSRRTPPPAFPGVAPNVGPSTEMRHSSHRIGD